MPRRDDIHTILIVGSGPIVIGQSCEFDYSGTQACKALREEGYRVVLVNSNPATIMTGPQLADRAYIEPITPAAVEKILAAEATEPHPVDALLPTLGGQTGLNTAVPAAAGTLERFGVEMIGATREVIHRAEDRTEFKNTCLSIGLDASPIRAILIEESVLGWKEYELEVMRDAVVRIIRAIGVETGGSNIQFAVHPQTGRTIVVEMNPRVSRSSALASKATGFPIAKIASKLAVGYTLDEIPNDITRQTPACFEPTIDNVVTKIPRWTFEKFPDADETLTTQMASVGEVMSIGRTFKESLQKGIRSMEVKRFGLGLDANDKWLAALRETGTGSRERSDTCLSPFSAAPDGQSEMEWPIADAKLRRKLSVPAQGRLYYVRYAFKMGWIVPQVHELTKIDPWFVAYIKGLVAFEDELAGAASPAVANAALLRRAKEWGYSDVQLATAWDSTPEGVRDLRERWGVRPVYKLVDTCAAEFEAHTPYYYPTYENLIRRVEPGEPPGGTGLSVEEAREVAQRIGYPVLCGRATSWAGGPWRSSPTRRSSTCTWPARWTPARWGGRTPS